MPLILIARVGGGFGVRGEVRIVSLGDDPAALLTYGPLLRKDGSVALTPVSGRVHKGALVARTREIDTPEAADALRGLELYVPREALPAPDEDEFYLADLIGCAVATADGEALGVVIAVENFGAGDILEVKPKTGPSRYLPFTREAVPQVLIAERRLIANPPEEVD